MEEKRSRREYVKYNKLVQTSERAQLRTYDRVYLLNIRPRST